MSAEGKKKRGESGQSKAKTAPFRLNGLAANRTVVACRGVQPDFTGANMVRGAIGGMLAAKLGYQMFPTHRFAQLVDQSLDNCPTGARTFDSIN